MFRILLNVETGLLEQWFSNVEPSLVAISLTWELVIR